MTVLFILVHANGFEDPVLSVARDDLTFDLCVPIRVKGTARHMRFVVRQVNIIR